MKMRTGVLLALSPQNLLDCSVHLGNRGCMGGYLSRAFLYIIQNNGIDSNNFYPYEHKVQTHTRTPDSTGSSVRRLLKICCIKHLINILEAAAHTFFRTSERVFQMSRQSNNVFADVSHPVIMFV